MDRLETLLALIEQQATARAFGAFLKDLGLPSSGTWAELRERARDAVASTRVAESSLLEFLGESEEYGRQHVFLYHAAGPHEVPSQRQCEAWLGQRGWGEALQTPVLVDRPDQPTVTHVRRDPVKNGNALTLKVIETRTYIKTLGTVELGNGRFTREYQREQVRAVNVVRLHPNGWLEVRIFSHQNGSQTYSDDVNRVLALLTGLVDPSKYGTVSLVTAKKKLYESRHELEGVVSFSGAHLRNSSGINVTVACGRDVNLFTDAPTDRGLQTMVDSGSAYHDALNLWWLKQAKGRPTQEVHVIIAGESNEFAVTQQTSRADYEFVLAQLWQHNK